MSDYIKTLKTISNMDAKQLMEFFNDLNDIDTVQFIADCAFNFIDNYKEAEEGGEHESVDWKRQDDAQRYRDIKSTQDSLK